jgi:hypothetical protein
VWLQGFQDLLQQQSTSQGLDSSASRAEMVVGRSDLLQSPGDLMLGTGAIDLLLQEHAAHSMFDELSVL